MLIWEAFKCPYTKFDRHLQLYPLYFDLRETFKFIFFSVNTPKGYFLRREIPSKVFVNAKPFCDPLI